MHVPCSRRWILLSLAIAGLIGTPQFAGAFDAGAQLRRFQDETQRRLTAKPAEPAIQEPSAPSIAAEAAAASDARVHVAAFAVTGVTCFSASEVNGVLQPFVGRELDTAGIHAAADALNRHYRDAGYFMAKVFIPPQEVGDTVRLEVYEGVLDARGIEVLNTGRLVDTRVVEDVLRANIPAHQPIHRADFERALLIAEDLPGITTSSTLYPGEHVGTARLQTTLRDVPRVSGNIDIDNFGTESTDQYRLGTTLYLNSPGHVGDQLVTRLVTSGDQSNYAYLTYLRPLSALGTRIGASLDYFDYDADYIVNLGYSDGEASDLRLYLTHPLVRSRHGNLTLRADLSRLDIDDRNDLQVNAERQIDTFSVSLHEDDDHEWLGTGLSIIDVSMTGGSTRVEGNAAYRGLDEATADTDGGFVRLGLHASRLQQLDAHWSLYVRSSGQWASTNLDSSQKFYLGGPVTVSGYPVGEAGGDDGAELLVELRRDIALPWAGTLQSRLFFQQGWISNHKDRWAGWKGANPDIENDFSLQSLGLGFTKTLPQAWVLRGTVGWQVGDNPMQDPMSGEASDGSKDDYRAWFQVIRYF